jgi:hypothetical protein
MEEEEEEEEENLDPAHKKQLEELGWLMGWGVGGWGLGVGGWGLGVGG